MRARRGGVRHGTVALVAQTDAAVSRPAPVTLYLWVIGSALPLVMAAASDPYLGLPLLASGALVIFGWAVLWMKRHRISEWMERICVRAERDFNVNPKRFVALYLFSFLPFYASLPVIAAGIRDESTALVISGTSLNRIAWAAPYAYVWLRGTLPIRTRVLLLTWVTVGILWWSIRTFT